MSDYIQLDRKKKWQYGDGTFPSRAYRIVHFGMLKDVHTEKWEPSVTYVPWGADLLDPHTEWFTRTRGNFLDKFTEMEDGQDRPVVGSARI